MNSPIRGPIPRRPTHHAGKKQKIGGCRRGDHPHPPTCWFGGNLGHRFICGGKHTPRQPIHPIPFSAECDSAFASIRRTPATSPPPRPTLALLPTQHSLRTKEIGGRERGETPSHPPTLSWGDLFGGDLFGGLVARANQLGGLARNDKKTLSHFRTSGITRSRSYRPNFRISSTSPATIHRPHTHPNQPPTPGNHSLEKRQSEPRIETDEPDCPDFLTRLRMENSQLAGTSARHAFPDSEQSVISVVLLPN